MPTHSTTHPNTLLLKTEKDSASYALGISVGQSLEAQNLSNINTELFLKGLKEITEKKKVQLTDAQVMNIITAYAAKMHELRTQANIAAGKKFLEANGKRPGVVTLPDGLEYEVLKAGTDTIKPTLADKVTCHYHGTLIDGTVFDSSVDRGEPVTFPLNGVIKGWQEALQLMTIGSKWKIYLPSDLAYGNKGAGEKIGPGATLVFTVELLGVQK
ncbi:MAG: FKBP-type peptidyl-prolyl cis-trans isomerase [Hydrotalea flava]|nr:FKBP-type peptidyl-prolyl cis-trans isomerase [Hydrotalea flava]NIM38932.1 FKBP-type peptidyl-prolyl cis-trans isomerase [Hydrotalea flava]NIN04122.1 FKBP-type peptidyl-prolyl cis-trans isomerase [Hydrotalea flava]NIN15794.1 FKBP-type peptidyl-prolyl cis-trans isomerase [Hydrotalea flava]NIO94858.1 FKBP-type peptidyl-prolyl cis-trans isomerase [Hydrotalea flava]